jgi:uncharacterized protein (TIGR02594 family)
MSNINHYIVTDIQNQLIKLGYNIGQADGILGAKTRRAIMQFQAKNNLIADGIVGAKTSAILFKNIKGTGTNNSIPNHLPWLYEAYRLINTQEITGQMSNPLILDWAKDLNLFDYNNDDIPWCGLFIGHVISSQLPFEPLPNNILSARNWLKFGRKTSATLGAIGVFWRESPTSWQGHVGLYCGEDKDAYHILGGNQSNAVNIKRIARNRLLEFRYPETALDTPIITRILELKDNQFSINEK